MKIHHRYTGAVIYEAGAESMAELVMEAVRLRADLTYADLTYANLTGADLTNADLSNANLTGADLTGAYLTGTVLGEHSKGAQ